MPWERFIKHIPEGMSRALYDKPAKISLHACGVFQFNLKALAMVHACKAEWVELHFETTRNLIGFTFHDKVGTHRFRLSPSGAGPSKKVGCTAFLKEYGITCPSKAVQLNPRVDDGMLCAAIPEGRV